MLIAAELIFLLGGLYIVVTGAVPEFLHSHARDIGPDIGRKMGLVLMAPLVLAFGFGILYAYIFGSTSFFVSIVETIMLVVSFLVFKWMGDKAVISEDVVS